MTKQLKPLKTTNNGRFAKDSYRRFIQMYSSVVLGVENHLFEELIDNYKLTKGVLLDTDLDEGDWDGLIKNFKELVKKEKKINFPQEVHQQLFGAIDAVFYHGKVKEQKNYRKLNHISGSLGYSS